MRVSLQARQHDTAAIRFVTGIRSERSAGRSERPQPWYRRVHERVLVRRLPNSSNCQAKDVENEIFKAAAEHDRAEIE